MELVRVMGLYEFINKPLKHTLGQSIPITVPLGKSAPTNNRGGTMGRVVKKSIKNKPLKHNVFSQHLVLKEGLMRVIA